MSYPGQPDPYGQNPYGQQPNPYGQQPNPYGQQQPYGQQPYNGEQYGGQGYYGQPQFGPPGPPPPPKRNVGMVVGLIAAVVVLAVFGVTAFAWPGFLVSKDDNTTSGTGGSTSCAKPGGSASADDVAEAMVACMKAKDKAGVATFVCSDASREVRTVIDRLDSINNIKLIRTVKVSSSEARAYIQVGAGSRTDSFQAVLAKSNGWCWKRNDSSNASSTARPSPTRTTTTTEESQTGPAPGDATELLNKFLDAVNAKNASAAKIMLCKSISANLEEEIDTAIGQNPELKLDNATSGSQPPGSVILNMSGKLGGKKAYGVIGAFKSYENGWCIIGFYPSHY